MNPNKITRFIPLIIAISIIGGIMIGAYYTQSTPDGKSGVINASSNMCKNTFPFVPDDKADK